MDVKEFFFFRRACSSKFVFLLFFFSVSFVRKIYLHFVMNVNKFAKAKKPKSILIIILDYIQQDQIKRKEEKKEQRKSRKRD